MEKENLDNGIKPDVKFQLPSEVKEVLLEAQYRLSQAIDIFNGSSGLNTGKEDKYIKMTECVDSIEELLKRGN